jgi:hypothetical protein
MTINKDIKTGFYWGLGIIGAYFIVNLGSRAIGVTRGTIQKRA